MLYSCTHMATVGVYMYVAEVSVKCCTQMQRENIKCARAKQIECEPERKSVYMADYRPPVSNLVLANPPCSRPQLVATPFE